MSRPKLNMPLKENNSPRSQWISNVSLLKNQLKDGELVVERPGKKKETATKLTWNQLEAQLGKRMRETPTLPNTSSRPDRPALPSLNTNNLKSSGTSIKNNPLSPTSATLNLIPHPHHSPTRSSTNNASASITAPLPPGIQSSPSKRPTLNIPTSPHSKDILKRVHNGTAQLPNRNMKSPKVEQNKSIPETRQSSIEADGKYDSTASVESESLLKKSLQVETINDVVNESKRRRNDNSNSNNSDKNKTLDRTVVTKEQRQQQPNSLSTARVENNQMKQDAPIFLRPHNGTASVNMEHPPPLVQSVTGKERSAVNQQQQQQQQQQQKKVPRPEAPTKTKGSLSWLRRALKPNSSKQSKPSISMTTMTQVSILTSDSNNTKSSSAARSKCGHSTSSTTSAKSHRGRKSTSTKMVEKYFHPTTPVQMGLWLSELKKAIRTTKQEEEQQPNILTTETKSQQQQEQEQRQQQVLVVDIVPNSLPPPQQQQLGLTMESNIRQFQSNNQDQMTYGEGTINTMGEHGEDVYYHKNRDVGVYVDYSTFDDGDSVSSIELLFKWLTCRDLNDDHHPGSCGTRHGNRHGDDTVMTPPGTVIATESNVSDDLSIDFEARPTRRTFFSR